MTEHNIQIDKDTPRYIRVYVTDNITGTITIEASNDPLFRKKPWWMLWRKE